MTPTPLSFKTRGGGGGAYKDWARLPPPVVRASEPWAQAASSSGSPNATNAENTLQRVKIHGEWLTVLQAYPKGTTSQLEHDQLFIDKLI